MRLGRFARGCALVLAISLAQAAIARKPAPLPPPPPTSALIDNVNGLTTDGEGRLVRFDGLLIDADGRVERRLQPGDPRPASLIFRMDAGGRTLIPGLVDAGIDIVDLGIAMVTLDLRDTASLAEAQARITAYAREGEGRKWILGRGWDADKWGLAAPPSPADLDIVTGDIPACLLSADGARLWANSAALRAAGALPGPRQRPLDRAEMARRLRAVLPLPAPKDRDLALDRAQKRLLAAGYALVTDIGITIEDWQSLRRMGDRGALRLRVVGYAGGIGPMVTIAGPAPTPWLYGDRLRLAGVHFTLDGALAARAAWLKAPYADAPSERGALAIDATALRNQMSRAAMDDFQIAVTAHGDAAVAEALAAFDEMAATYKGDRRWRMEDAEAIDPADLSALAARGVILTLTPPQNDAALVRLGEARAAAQPSLMLLARAGVRIAVASGAPVGTPSPFAALAALVAHAPGSEADALAGAIAAATRGGAHAAFADRLTGALEPGQYADFLILDRDIATAGPDRIAGTRVLENWIGGQRAYVSAAAP